MRNRWVVSLASIPLGLSMLGCVEDALREGVVGGISDGLEDFISDTINDALTNTTDR